MMLRSKLIASFRLQCRVIWALMIREMHTRYGRENIGALWVIGEPILFCAGVTIVWSAIRPSHEHGLAVPAFVVTGYVPLTMWRHCISRSVRAFEANGALLFHRQVTPLDIITTRAILEVVGTIAAGLIVYIAVIYSGYMDPPADYGLLYAGMAYQVAFSYASAMILACLTEMSELVERGMQVTMYLSLPLSGAFTMQSWLPVSFQRVAAWSPSVQNMEMIRGGQFGSAVTPLYDLVYNTRATVVLLLIGVLMTLRVRKHLVIQ